MGLGVVVNEGLHVDVDVLGQSLVSHPYVFDALWRSQETWVRHRVGKYCLDVLEGDQRQYISVFTGYPRSRSSRGHGYSYAYGLVEREWRVPLWDRVGT